jgi:hypothetical protein
MDKRLMGHFCLNASNTVLTFNAASAPSHAWWVASKT